MTPKEFIDKVVDLYVEAQHLKFNNKDYIISRGGKHSISSITEDLFAVLLAEHLDSKDLQFIINQTFSYTPENGKSVSFIPDLAIINDGVLTHIFDVKMDLGYKRDYRKDQTFLNAKKRFEKFRSQNINIIYKKESVTISSNIINQIVVITSENGGRESLKANLKEDFDKYDWANIYFLSNGSHPNCSKGVTEPNEEEFTRLFKDIILN